MSSKDLQELDFDAVAAPVEEPKAEKPKAKKTSASKAEASVSTDATMAELLKMVNSLNAELSDIKAEARNKITSKANMQSKGAYVAPTPTSPGLKAREFAKEQLYLISIAPVFRKTFGSEMHIGVNGISAFIPCDGKEYPLNKSHYLAAKEKLAKVQKRMFGQSVLRPDQDPDHLKEQDIKTRSYK
jgi:hypothetical protein